MIEEEDETKTTYVSTNSSEKPTRNMYSGQIIGMNVIIFIYYAHVNTRNNNVVLIITESVIKSRRVLGSPLVAQHCYSTGMTMAEAL